MALFSRLVRKVRNGTARLVIIEDRQAKLPAYYRGLRVLCQNLAAHALPVQMQFSEFAVSHHGQRVAIYVCPCHQCPCRQGWVQHRVTGRPFRLY